MLADNIDIVFITFSIRSNVGKSTLLNSLLSLEESPLIKALVSDKPGETKHLQFYCVGRNEDPKSTVQGPYGLYCISLAHYQHPKIKCAARASIDEYLLL
jgi:GTP-binding protein EngB required for normal cell division